jgi:hypothetical protein
MGIKEVNMKINNLLRLSDTRDLTPKEERELSNLKSLRNKIYNQYTLTEVKFYTPDEFTDGDMIYSPGWYPFIHKSHENIYLFKINNRVIFKNIPNIDPVSSEFGLVRWWSESEIRESNLNQLLDGIEINPIKIEWLV